MYHAYGKLKTHFDRLLTAPPVQNHTIDPIRGLYHEAFNRKIALFDVYRTILNLPCNPIRSIITLLGDDDHKPVTTGVMMDYDGIVYIDSFSEDILKPMDESTATVYIRQIIKNMDVIVSQDHLYNDLTFAKNNPYALALRVIPIYMAFHHVGTCMPEALDFGIFEEIILEKGLVPTNSGQEYIILESLANGKYKDEPWSVYNAMTCNNSIKLFTSIKKDKYLT